MDKESLAATLNGRQYRDEITNAEATAAHQHGLVVLFGYSDDGAEFRGVFTDEIGCYNGGTILINRKGVMQPHSDSCDCPFCGYEAAKERAAKIEAIWGADGYSWTYATEIPHACFDIMEEGEKYCRGIVFETMALPNS